MDKNAYHHGNLRAAILDRAAETISVNGVEALSLRGIARDLGVSHGAPNAHFKNKAALLSELVAEGWRSANDAIMQAVNNASSDNPHIRLNAMGKGALRWALDNPVLFQMIIHPDVNRFASEELLLANAQFSDAVWEAVAETQQDGRHPEIPLPVLTAYTHAVPFGVAMVMINPLLGKEFEEPADRERMIEQIIGLVVPIPSD